jgi:arylformamidase
MMLRTHALTPTEPSFIPARSKRPNHAGGLRAFDPQQLDPGRAWARSYHLAMPKLIDLSHTITDGHDLTELALERVAAVPAVCLDRRGQTTIDLTDDELLGLAGYAVLIITGHAEHWGSDAYFVDHPHLSEAAAKALVRAGVACVGVDTLNIDSTQGGQRPVHTVLLRSDIPIIEHLVNLEQLPPSGFTFTAVPPKIKGAGTFTVRAFAAVAEETLPRAASLGEGTVEYLEPLEFSDDELDEMLHRNIEP